MRSRQLNEFLRLVALLTMAMLASAQLVLAETAKPSSQPTTPAMSEENSPTYRAELPPESQGDLSMAHGKYATAIESYQQSSIRSAAIYNKIGIAYHHLFALEEARRNYEMALAMDPKFSAALNNLAAVYQGERNYGRAERTYKKALKRDPNSAIMYRNLGTTYFGNGKYKQGTKAYQKALMLNPHVFDHSETQPIEEISSRSQRMAINYYLAKTYATAGKNELALTYLRKALDEGFKDRRHLMEDKEFSQLRTTPEFHLLIVQQHLD